MILSPDGSRFLVERSVQVNDTLPMGTIVTVSTDWGEAMDKHPLRGKGKGKVLWMIDPEEGFVER